MLHSRLQACAQTSRAPEAAGSPIVSETGETRRPEPHYALPGAQQDAAARVASGDASGRDRPTSLVVAIAWAYCRLTCACPPVPLRAPTPTLLRCLTSQRTTPRRPPERVSCCPCSPGRLAAPPWRPAARRLPPPAGPLGRRPVGCSAVQRGYSSGACAVRRLPLRSCAH